MTTELLILAAAATLCLALPLVYMALYAKQVGMPVINGNREDAPARKGAAGRGLRAHHNLIENLVPFAIAVLAARAVGVSNSVTLIGAWLFLGGRLVHAVSYIAGVTGIRTLAYMTGVVGTFLILSQLL